jgi:hypothetical protein
MTPAVTTPCTPWAGSINRNGYGVKRIELRHVRGEKRKRRWILAHRLIWVEKHGPIPGDLRVDHLCRNRRCVNTEHMELILHGENVLRGIGPGAMNRRKTHCINGHPFDESNTYLTSQARRHCRICHASAERARRARISEDRAATAAS